ncbi:hypothetical protein AURDEDRAFT_112103 [Auricularia subglabra TFB-10046 SS5]|nr:hypothetical protein AURDEDRAFT_112103 [Auricularia subglabra TFB-10046 SS5]
MNFAPAVTKARRPALAWPGGHCTRGAFPQFRTSSLGSAGEPEHDGNERPHPKSELHPDYADIAAKSLL